MLIRLVVIIVGCVLSLTAWAKTEAEQSTEKYLITIKSQPEKLKAFFYEMPKGGDLHNHLGGSSMAENMLRYAKGENLCIDPKTFTVVPAPCEEKYQLDNIDDYPEFYNQVIEAWSMHNFKPGKETGHDHFFNAFAKFHAIDHSGEIISEIAERAGEQNELYVELMVTPDRNESGMLGKQIGWKKQFAVMRSELLNKGLKPIIAKVSEQIDKDEQLRNTVLLCGTTQAQPGCNIKMRYLYQVLREQPPAQVFAQLLTGFEVASKDPRFVGINIVQPEDGKISMRDYHLHMRMIAYLHKLYPGVHISLHAGELTKALVSPNGLRTHINEAVTIAHAERIGHGVDIVHEDNSEQLLNEMARKRIAVEINLTSNDVILNVRGKHHPILIYMKHHVPVVLATDDEGVGRTNLSEEYLRAVKTYSFSYLTMKNLSRNSLTYSFLPGQSLWQDQYYHRMNSACAKDSPSAEKISDTCQAFLQANEKAALQWKLEKDFSEFEKRFTH